MMKKLFSRKKKKDDKQKSPSVEEAAEKLNTKGDHINEKIKKLNDELLKCKDLLKKSKGGPLQNAIKSRARVLIQQKKMLEMQRNVLYNHAFTLDQVTFASEGIIDAQHTVSAIKVGNKDLAGTLKQLKIDKIDKMQDEIQDLASYGAEMHESIGQNYSVPEHLDEDDLLGELNALEDDMASGNNKDQMPAYLKSEKTSSNAKDGVRFPSASLEHGTSVSQDDTNDEEEDDVPATAKVSSLKA